jgi:Family of unknown function (DUF5360)
MIMRITDQPPPIPASLIWTLRLIDGGMLLCWAAAALACAGLIALPASLMYGGYGTPVIDAWNWSFAPLDVAFALTGLAAVQLAARGDARWWPLVLVSLSLTLCAGLMALSFWALRGEFVFSWWATNAVLMAAGLYWLVRLVRRS